MPRADNAGRRSPALVLAVVAAVLAVLYFAAEVLIPLAAAVLLTFVLAPLANRLERLRLGRVPSVIIAVVLALGAIGLVAWIAASQVRDLAGNLPEYRDNIHEKAEGFKQSMAKLARHLKLFSDVGKELAMPAPPTTTPATTQPAGAAPTTPAQPLPVRVVPEPESPIAFVRNNIGTLLKPLAMTGVALIFMIFMLLQREDLRDRLIRLLAKRDLSLTTQALTDAGRRISRYLLMLLLVNTCYGILVAIGLHLIGVPNAILWGLLAMLCRFIPYIGPWIGAAVPIILSFAVFPGYKHLVITILMYAGLELITANVVEPWLYGTSTGMSELAVLVAAVFWTWLWGPVGLLLSMPLTVCLVVLGRYVPQLHFLHILLGDEPVMPPPMRVYQRLLADDEEEAWEMVEEHLKEKGVLACYDEVIIPALRLIEQDHYRGQIDDHRRGHLIDSVRDLIEDVSQETNLPEASPLTVEPEGGNGNGGKDKQHEQMVLCLPAHDEADELVAMMLAQLLVQHHCPARFMQTASLASEMVEAAAAHDTRIVCISALPPSAVAHARYLCKRLRARLPELRLVIGLWLAKAKREEPQPRLACAPTDAVTTTLATALERLKPLAQSMMVVATQQPSA